MKKYRIIIWSLHFFVSVVRNTFGGSKISYGHMHHACLMHPNGMCRFHLLPFTLADSFHMEKQFCETRSARCTSNSRSNQAALFFSSSCPYMHLLYTRTDNRIIRAFVFCRRRCCVTLCHRRFLSAPVAFVAVDVYNFPFRLIINSTHVRNRYKYWRVEWGRMSITVKLAETKKKKRKHIG